MFNARYNGDGIRVKKTNTRGALGLQIHDYSYSPYGLRHENNPSTVHTPGFGHRSNGINSFYHTDWIGSTRYASDTNGGFPQGLRFDAYGNRSGPRKCRGGCWSAGLPRGHPGRLPGPKGRIGSGLKVRTPAIIRYQIKTAGVRSISAFMGNQFVQALRYAAHPGSGRRTG